MNNQPPVIFGAAEWTKLGGPLNAVPQGRTAARGAAMRRTQSAVDAAAELVKFSTSPDLTPKRTMGYSNISASPHRVRRIDLRDQGRGDGAAPPAAKVARLGTRPPPPPPVWERRSSSIDSVATEVVGVSPRTEDGLLPGGGVDNENDETKFSPVSESASVRTRPIAPRPPLGRTPSPPAKNHCQRYGPYLFGQAGAAEDPPPFSLPSARKSTATAPGAQPPLSVSQMPPHDVRLVCDAAVQLACAGVATALQSVADQARAVASCISPTQQLQP